MKTLLDYISEAEYTSHNPVAGDNFIVEFEDGSLIETYVLESTEDAILLDSNQEVFNSLAEWSNLEPTVIEGSESCQCCDKTYEDCGCNEAELESSDIVEAEYQGRKVTLNKPMRGDTKKFKVFVKDPSTGNIKKVNFGHGGTSARRAGQKTMRIKKSNPARRRSFRARHHCENPGPKTKARYWSCRAW